jgi:hypothetical protein
VSLDVGAVDGDRADDAGRAGQSLEHLKPDTLPAPTVEAVVDRRVRPVFRRAVSPAGATSQHVHDAADNAAIIHTVRTAPTAR